ncbi:uncharacterized protein B0H18DRAFT_304443 [Fomitopsis serialis]|uniref:uncharacterized protein n=1 Tax=Fomitopsis serialis TaxID=139415 RepID=UPI0020071F19|nr:uncharacterized protein B0H18DRAFT_304443 [Neoantrodia serialis]KAH9926947.1 hypothetical protein B0H18DRAFT_304443 [Neoantrodia serialis]
MLRLLKSTGGYAVARVAHELSIYLEQRGSELVFDPRRDSGHRFSSYSTCHRITLMSTSVDAPITHTYVRCIPMSFKFCYAQPMSESDWQPRMVREFGHAPDVAHENDEQGWTSLSRGYQCGMPQDTTSRLSALGLSVWTKRNRAPVSQSQRPDAVVAPLAKSASQIAEYQHHHRRTSELSTGSRLSLSHWAGTTGMHGRPRNVMHADRVCFSFVYPPIDMPIK